MVDESTVALWGVAGSLVLNGGELAPAELARRRRGCPSSLDPDPELFEVEAGAEGASLDEPELEGARLSVGRDADDGDEELPESAEARDTGFGFSGRETSFVATDAAECSSGVPSFTIPTDSAWISPLLSVLMLTLT